MSIHYDYIVIGAGPAGCICAGELKKKNYTVCILEKQSAHYRKVCGDGISYACVQELHRIGLPIERFLDAGAVRIQKYIHYIDGKMYVDMIKNHEKEAYGLARDKTDAVFRTYVSEDLGVPIFYNTEVEDIKSAEGGYIIGDFFGKKIVIAAGASGRINLDTKACIRSDAKRPVGVSAILRGKPSEEPFFLFDYREEYHGTYGWIFSISEDEYNVGLWLNEEKDSLNEKFDAFVKLRVNEYLGCEYQWVKKTRGAIMGIGDRIADVQDGIYVIGDAANTSNPKDGEGISLAIRDALDFVQREE